MNWIRVSVLYVGLGDHGSSTCLTLLSVKTVLFFRLDPKPKFPLRESAVQSEFPD